MNTGILQNSKTTNKIRAIVSLVLLAILLLASLGPIGVIEMDAQTDRQAANGIECITGTSGIPTSAFPETVRFTPLNTVKAAILLARLKIYKESDSIESKVKMAEVLTKEVESNSEALAIVGLTGGFVFSNDQDARNANFYVSLVFILILLVIFIATTVTFLVGLIRMIIAVATQEEKKVKKAIAGQWIMGCGMGFFGYYAIFQNSGIGKVGWAATLMLICGAAYIVFSLVFTFLRPYRKQDLACVNLTRYCSIGGLVAALLLFAGMLLFEKPGSVQAAEEAELAARLTDAFVVVFCGYVMATLGYNWLNISLNRVAQTRRKNQMNNPVTSLAAAIVYIVASAAAIGLFIGARYHLIPMFYKGAMPPVASGTKISIALWIIACLIALANEIVLKVLLSSQCPDLDDDAILKIYTGTAEYPNEIAAETPAPAQPVAPAPAPEKRDDQIKFD